jgi:N4-gp56 family major capsid protein
MAAFTTTMSGTAALDVSAVLAFDQQFIIAAGEAQTMDAFASYKQVIGAKSIDLTKYSLLSPATTPLTELDDPASVAMADAQILITPAEYGNVVTTSKLVNLQSGGKVDLAAARLVGANLAQTKNELAAAVLAASSNVLVPSGVAAASVPSTDLMTMAFLNKLYNKLRRNSVQRIGDSYALIVHDDVAVDIRQLAGWTDVQKYANADQVLKNEIGAIAGFRVVINNASALLSVDGGATTVDAYSSIALGFNGLGLVESMAPKLTITGPFDKLGRFVNIGWNGCFKYSIVDTDAVWIGFTASSVGNNS